MSLDRNDFWNNIKRSEWYRAENSEGQNDIRQKSKVEMSQNRKVHESNWYLYDKAKFESIMS